MLVTRKRYLIIGEDPTQGLDGAILTAKKYAINFTENNRKNKNLHCNGANSYLFVICKKINNFKEKDSEIVAPLLILHISKDSSVDNIKKTGFKDYVYDFSVDYDAIVVGDILDIQKYLMKKNDTP